MPGPNLRPVVIAARETLKTGRASLEQRHRSGAPSTEVCAGLADLWDKIVLQFFEAAVEDSGDERITDELALVAHGGYGRRDIAPFSDVDLMLLRSSGVSDARVQPIAQRLNQDICDTGLTLGFSQRTPREAYNLATADPTIFTSITESRFLAGSMALFGTFMEGLRRKIRARSTSLITAIEKSRDEERNQYGGTVFLLQPNIKRSAGGLRDIQLLRWIGFAKYRESDPAVLERKGALSREDGQRLADAHAFLLRLRNEMHFHAKKAEDVLDRTEQIRLAELFDYKADKGWVPVEVFMRDYFHHTSLVRSCVAHFVATAKNKGGIQSAVRPLLSHKFEGDFLVGPSHIGTTRRGHEKLKGDVGQVLRLMDIANLYGKWIDHHTWQSIRDDMMDRPSIELNAETSKRFLSLMSQTGRLGDLLRRLHELRVLEKIVPGMSHARCLMQFNDYHKYTVDEHSIRAVEEATALANHPGLVGDVYRQMKDKTTLHLALLIHDLGKGHPEDHSEVGARLAEQLAERLQLSQRTAELLRFLVHKHLLMARLGMWRDTNDPAVVLDLAVQVGSPEVLKMLFVLTCADIAAVGPEALTDWKLTLITDLYKKTLRQLSGGSIEDDAEQAKKLRAAVLSDFTRQGVEGWLIDQVEELPDQYLESATPQQVLQDLQHLEGLQPDSVVAWGSYSPERQAVTFSIGAFEQITPGIFHRLTGVLSSQGMQILSAEINAFSRGMVLDRFHVYDDDFEGEPPPERLDDVCRKLERALTNPTDEPPTFRKLWSAGAGQAAHTIKRVPASVRIDRSTSDRYTIIDVFAHDRRGLLYTITRKIFELGLSVHVAKIGSHLDQVVDVFYVTDNTGKKVDDEARVEQIRSELLERIQQFESS